MIQSHPDLQNFPISPRFWQNPCFTTKGEQERISRFSKSQHKRWRVRIVVRKQRILVPTREHSLQFFRRLLLWRPTLAICQGGPLFGRGTGFFRRSVFPRWRTSRKILMMWWILFFWREKGELSWILFVSMGYKFFWCSLRKFGTKEYSKLRTKKFNLHKKN